jgi:RNA ligase (TIGR02306 family)
MTTDQLLAGEGMRKLATLRTVSSCEKHPNADRLYIVKFKSCLWQTVTGVLYRPGDAVVLFEPDSKFDSFEVAKAAGLPDKIRVIKPIKIRGLVSQVYICPASALSEYIGVVWHASEYFDVDLSAKLSISKHIHKPEASGCKLTDALSDTNLFELGLVPKTDELRLQSSPWLLDQTCSDNWYVTDKLDGTSTTYAWYDSKFHLGGRRTFLSGQHNAYAQVAKSLGLEASMAEFGRNIAIQGELCGPKIQGNKLGLEKTKFFAFKVWDIGAQQALPIDQALVVCDTLNIEFVPILLRGSGLHETDLSYLTGLANSATWWGKPAEGIVVSNFDCSCSFKIINESYRG